MGFKVTARTLLQLGAELISSDAVAFYELIKNAFDALSPTVDVRIVKRLNKEVVDSLLAELYRFRDEEETVFDFALLSELKNKLLRSINQDAYQVERFKERVRLSDSLEVLIRIIERANYILIADKGEGMSLADLDSVYLTIGTRFRQQQRQYHNERERPVLGEKGIGRLSVMRLGEGLKVVTSKHGEPNYNELNIDWSIFSHYSDQLLDSIDIQPNPGGVKADAVAAGTQIFIYKLYTDWNKDLLQEVANEQLSKFIDPFQKLHRNFIRLWFNHEPVIIPPLSKSLFESAHAVVEAKLIFNDGEPALSGFIDYKLYNRQKSFAVEGIHLLSIIQKNKIVLTKLGTFSVKFYWFNNRLVREIEGIGKTKQVRDLIKNWAGGLMVYRDGFRVFPYGSLEDDWLQLDPRAFAAGGYKVNRRQLIGKVDISSENNPALIDQTNREGLRDCPEKTALIKLLQYVLWSEFRTLLDNTEAERLTNVPLDLAAIEARLETNTATLLDNLNLLVTKFPQIQEENQSLNAIKEALNLNKQLLNELRTEKESVQQRMEVTLHLAGLGLMVDIIAHELNRSTEHTLSTLNNVSEERLSDQTKALLSTLSTQLRTLKARLKILDPLGPSGRQIKEEFDLNDLITETFLSHQIQFERHRIIWKIEPLHLKWKVKAVKGMFVQILENLIANSVYWLKQMAFQHPNYAAKISVYLDKPANRILITDNGPGIPVARKEDVFQPFVTTKPPGDGKGLGLYISREIAKYHGATLRLIDDPETASPLLHTFSLDLTGIK